MRARPRTCPWQNHPTHNRNRELQVNGERPIVYGYCGQELECASCAGTLYKPNLIIEQGRAFAFVECPFCRANDYRKRVDKLKTKLPVGSGPQYTPARPPPEPPPDALPPGARRRRRRRLPPPPEG